MISSTTSGSSVTCPICLENFSDKKKMVITSCNHNFHEKCATVWLLNNSSKLEDKTCPLCRKNPLPLVRAENETNEIEKNPFIESQFAFAIRKNDVESVKKRLETDPTLISKPIYIARCDTKFTPLGMACCGGHIEMIKTLIEAGADINKPDQDRCTPLMLAVRAGNEAAVDELLRLKANVHARDKYGFSCVFIINNYPCNLSVVKKLMAHGANIHVISRREVTPLVTAASHGDLPLVRFFKDEGIDINKRGKSKSTALMRAVQNNHTEVAKFLLEAGADPNLRDLVKQPALLFSVQNRNMEITKALLEHKANTDFRTKNGLTPLYIAARDGLTPFVELLLEYNADKSIGYKSHFFISTRTPKEAAEANGHREIVEMLS